MAPSRARKWTAMLLTLAIAAATPAIAASATDLPLDCDRRHPAFDTAHPLDGGVDLVVRVALIPARGAKVIQHLLTAAAKITPRVLRSLA